MKFIILCEENSPSIIEAATPFDALQQYVKDNYCSEDFNTKVFDILRDSGRMELAELTRYANQHLLPAYGEIKAIYVLGEQIL